MRGSNHMEHDDEKGLTDPTTKKVAFHLFDNAVVRGGFWSKKFFRKTGGVGIFIRRSWYCSGFTRWHFRFRNLPCKRCLHPESVLCWLSMKSHFVSSRPLSAFRLQGHCGAEGNPSLIELRGVPKDTNKRKWETRERGGG